MTVETDIPSVKMNTKNAKKIILKLGPAVSKVFGISTNEHQLTCFVVELGKCSL